MNLFLAAVCNNVNDQRTAQTFEWIFWVSLGVRCQIEHIPSTFVNPLSFYVLNSCSIASAPTPACSGVK